jgi:recombination associated protein RdgC
VGALKGTISYVRFFVDGEVKARYQSKYLEAIALRAFRPLKPSDEDEERVGWCSIHQPIDLDLTADKVYDGDFVNLGLRVDRYRIPGAILKAHMAEAEAAMLAELGKERLSRSQKEDLRAMVLRKLKERSMPVMRTYDLSWDVGTGIVRFFGTTAKIHDVLLEIFEKTFNLGLIREGAYTRAERIGLGASALDAVATLEPFVLHREDDQ